jgi:ABC-type glutathione transport system ATPase component
MLDPRYQKMDEVQEVIPSSLDLEKTDLIIGIVGPCSSGKTTLIQGLHAHGFTARHIAQEHSFVPDMWQRISHPDILIFLDVSFETIQKRRSLEWQENDFKEQQERLAHARQHADIVIYTDQLSVAEVLERSLTCLKKKNGKN